MEIISIKRIPKWKFWKIDQWEVEVCLNNRRRKLSIYHSPNCFQRNESELKIFQRYIERKILTGSQWLSEAKTEDETTLTLNNLKRLEGKKIE